MTFPQVVSRDEWQKAREALLVEEKELTRARDAVSAERLGVTVDGAERHGLGVFIRDGDTVCHSYTTYARGAEILLNTFDFLDFTPLGRQEEKGIFNWVRRHDMYGT